MLDSTTFPLPPGRDQFLAIAARPSPPCRTKEEIRRKRQGGIYHFVAPALSTSASSDRAASLSLPPGADAAPLDAARPAGLWAPWPTIPDAAPSVRPWTPRSAIPGAAHPAGLWTPVTARSAMVGAALSALTSAAPPAPPCPSFAPPPPPSSAPPCPSFAPPPPPAPPSSWTTISPPASSAYSGDVVPPPPPPPPRFVRPSSSVYSGDNDDDDDGDEGDDGRPIMATYPAFAAPVLPLVTTRDMALFSNPVMMISGGVTRPARRRRILEVVEEEERERRRGGRVRMGLSRVGGVVKGFFERK